MIIDSAFECVEFSIKHLSVATGRLKGAVLLCIPAEPVLNVSGAGAGFMETCEGQRVSLCDIRLHVREPDREIRLRSHYFPFTEPSVELDVSCFLCGGKGCRVCSGEGWIEILGAGMVDPNVFGFVPGYDPEVVSGWAFGMGIERVAMLKYGIPHVKSFYDNDVRFLEQFRGAVR